MRLPDISRRGVLMAKLRKRMSLEQQAAATIAWLASTGERKAVEIWFRKPRAGDAGMILWQRPSSLCNAGFVPLGHFDHRADAETLLAECADVLQMSNRELVLRALVGGEWSGDRLISRNAGLAIEAVRRLLPEMLGEGLLQSRRGSPCGAGPRRVRPPTLYRRTTA